jgi:hypothetical protein
LHYFASVRGLDKPSAHNARLIGPFAKDEVDVLSLRHGV